MTDNNILAQASKNLLLVELKGIGGWTPNVRLKEASRILADKFGGSERAFKGTENLLPEPYDEEFKELKSAYGDVRASFYLATMPYGSTVDAKSGKPKADGKRAVVAAQIVDGTFMARHENLLRILDEKREAFAAALPRLIERIRDESALGDQFDAERYPTPDDVRNGWYYEDIIPEPIIDASAVRSMGLPPQVAQMIEDNLARRVEAQVQFGQQQLVSETLKYVRNMVTNLTKLDAYFSGQHQGKRPSVYQSLIDNVKDSLAKLKTYALPGTDEGDAMLQLVGGIEQRLDMDSIELSDLKNDGAVARKVLAGAKEATKLIDAWSGSETVFDAPEQAVSQPEPAPAPVAETKPVTAEDVDALLDGFEEDEPTDEQLDPETPAPAEEDKPTPEPAPMEEVAEANDDEELNDLLAGW